MVRYFTNKIKWIDDLREYFSRFGEIETASVMYHHDKHHSRGFGFVLFKSNASVNAVMQSGPHVIRNKTVMPPLILLLWVGGCQESLSKRRACLPVGECRNCSRTFFFQSFSPQQFVCLPGLYGFNEWFNEWFNERLFSTFAGAFFSLTNARGTQVMNSSSLVISSQQLEFFDEQDGDLSSAYPNLRSDYSYPNPPYGLSVRPPGPPGPPGPTAPLRQSRQSRQSPTNLSSPSTLTNNINIPLADSPTFDPYAEDWNYSSNFSRMDSFQIGLVLQHWLDW